MLGKISVYIVWYGDWSGVQGDGSTSTVQNIIQTFVSNLGESGWWNIMTSYTDESGNRISNNLEFGGSTSVSGSEAISAALISQLITTTVGNGALPKNTKGIYLVIPSQNIRDPSNFGATQCTTYCGWHSFSTFADGTRMIFGLITHPYGCPKQEGCLYSTYKTPNGNAAADGMVSVIAHELAEAATDPFQDAWYDSAGAENGDKCVWNMGSTAANYNIVLGSSKYLIQQMWLNAGEGGCVMSFG